MLITITLVYGIGLFIDVMEIDSAQYASIAREMADNNQWLQVQHRGVNYLDKPPLLFWLSALLFKVFGVSNFAFKLPSFLFTLLGVYSTYKLTKALFNKPTAQVATLLLYGCQAWYFFNNDVRTDAMLAGAAIFAMWQLYTYLQTRHWLAFVGGFTGIALAMLAKGPIGLIVPAMALGAYVLVNRRWKDIFNPMYIVGLAWVALLLTPMLLGLYWQYGGNGPLFFFWTQSFGRITGENIWKNDAGYFFFTHTFLWAFLPFSLVAVWAWGQAGINLVKNKLQPFTAPTALLWAGFTLPFIALSLSQFKLPHYINVVFPFAAILTANYLVNILPIKYYKGVGLLQAILGFLGLAFISFLYTYFKGNYSLFNNLFWFIFWSLLLFLFGGIYAFRSWRSNDRLVRLIFPSIVAFAFVNYTINLYVYPELLRYHSSSNIGKYLREENVKPNATFFFITLDFATEFYAGFLIKKLDNDNLKQALVPGTTLVTTAEGLRVVELYGLHPKAIQPFNHYHILMLTPKFINPNTRPQTIEKRYVLHF